MKDKLIVVGIVVFLIFILYLAAESKKQAKVEQCDGSERFFAYSGKIYACDNYKKPQGQQQQVSQGLEGG